MLYWPALVLSLPSATVSFVLFLQFLVLAPVWSCAWKRSGWPGLGACEASWGLCGLPMASE